MTKKTLEVPEGNSQDSPPTKDNYGSHSSVDNQEAISTLSTASVGANDSHSERYSPESEARGTTGPKKGDFDPSFTAGSETSAFSSTGNNPTTITETEVEPASQNGIGVSEGEAENNDDDYDDDDESDDSDDEQTEDIPLLKYSRPKSLKLSDVSASTFHDDYMIFATHLGVISIYTTNLQLVRTFRAHRASVLSVFTDGTYFATASMDGTVVIGSIKDEKDIQAYDFQRPVHAVVLDKNFSQTRSFISGGKSGKILYSTKNWLGKRSDVVIDEGDGPIVGLLCVDDVLFWMNDVGITAYNIITRQVIKVFERPADAPRSDEYWPRWAFPETDRVIIAWGNYVWSMRITAAKKTETVSSYIPSSVSFRANTGANERSVELENIYKMSSLIAGIASFSKHDQWLLLTYTPHTINSDGKRVFSNPDLQLVNSATGEVEWEEEIGLKDINNLSLNDYQLASSDDGYFIISARDLVHAEEFKLEDRLQWYIDHDRYDEVWRLSSFLNIPPLRRLNYGIKHVDNLVKSDWKEALKFLRKVLDVDESRLVVRDDKSTIASTAVANDDAYVGEVVNQWEEWSSIAIKTNHYEELTQVIPTTPKLAIRQEVYTKIMSHWMHEDDVTTFLTLLNMWDHNLYDIHVVISELEEILEDKESPELRQGLVQLYVWSQQPEKAVSHLIKNRSDQLIEFICNNHIIEQNFDYIPKMLSFKFDNPDALHTVPVDEIETKLAPVMNMLVNYRHEINPARFVQYFNSINLSVLTFVYLLELQSVDEYTASKFGNDMVKMLVEFRRSLLLPFLTKHDANYDLDFALKLCEQAGYVEEQVYLLGKVGNSKQAMHLIISDLNDPKMALDFAKQQQDRECWNLLLTASVDERDGGRPSFIKALIEGADDQTREYYDPLDILKRMPASISVQGLNHAVINFTKKNALNLVLHQLVLNILYKQAEKASRTYREIRLIGVDGEREIKEADLTRLIGVDVIHSSSPTTELTMHYTLDVANSTVPAYTALRKKLAYLSHRR
ncbi:hypothetical protein DIURU_001026 [Diutina rugosa]|uniref:Vps41 beta-propeller domain-containing protein n=1 Tax=Diutina rugosa TaxID=5481 RepID=A0A642UVT0_DIURU|nr:uncharacterized protein DIURU_001026 [Diutina rugosa]KAA8906448.1 hypothetical protein DIURU_001026 [Diutina rugosa]